MKHLILIFFLNCFQAIYAQTPLFVFESNNYNETNMKFTPVDNKLHISYTTHYEGLNYNEYFRSSHYIMDENGKIVFQDVIDKSDYPQYYAFINNTIFFDSALFHFGVLADYSNSVFKLFVRKTDMEFNLLKDTVIYNKYIGITDLVINNNSILAIGPSSDSNVIILKINTNLEIIDSSKFSLYDSFKFHYRFLKNDVIRFSSNYYKAECWLKLDSNLNISDTIFSNLFNISFYYNPSSFNLFINDSIFISPINYFNAVGYTALDSLFSQIAWNKWSINGNLLDTVIPFKDTLVSDYYGLGKCIVKYSQDSVIMAFSRNMNDIDIRTDSSSIAMIWSDINGNVSKAIQFGGNYCYLVEDIHRFNNGNILVAARRKLWSPSAPHNTFDEVIYLLNSNGVIIQEINMSDKIRSQVSIYPNPAKDYITIFLEDNSKTIQSFKLYSIQGILIRSKEFSANKVNVSDLSKGVYILELQFKDGNTYSKKFIKK